MIEYPYTGRPQQQQFYVSQQLPTSGAALWSMITGIIGALVGWCMFGLPCIAAIILGHVAIHQLKRGDKSGKGMAIAGLVTGYIALAPAIVLFFWLVMGGVLGGAAAVLPVPTITPTP